MQKIVVRLVDDVDGTESDTVETVSFGLDGVMYEIDLHEGNAGRLRERLAAFVEGARRTGGRMKRGAAGPATSATSGSGDSGRSREQTQAIRDWAKKNGLDVADRGRIPAAVLEAFEADAGKVKGQKGK